MPALKWLLLLILLIPARLPGAVTDQQRATIDRLTGAKGTYTAEEDVYRVNFPRTDVKISVEGATLAPFMGLTSWAAFTPAASGSLMVMGDLVLLEDEVNPALSAALDGGLEVTALHNHFFFDRPRVMFMHIGGMGAAGQLAAGVRKALDAAREVRASAPDPAMRFSAAAIPEKSSISTAPLELILATKGQTNAGMFKASFARKARMHGHEAGNQMGVNTWAAFAGSDDNAIVDGDFAMLESELQGVLRALRKAGINIVAIHNHMAGEEPRYVFLHYWGKGKAADLAHGLRAALDTQKR